MIWLSFGIGFCCGIFGWFCMCCLVFRGLKEGRIQAHKDMEILHAYWETANKIAKERNDIARGIRR